MKRKHVSPGVYYYETSLKNKKESFSRGYKKDIRSEVIEGSNEVLTFQRLKVTPPSLNLKNGETSQLEVKFITEIHGVIVEQLDVRTKCTYKSDNSNIVVDKEGNITAKKTGAHAIITVTYNNFTSKVSVSVASEKSYELRINKTELQLNKNESEELIVKYYTITDGVINEGVNVNSKCIWESTNSENVIVKNGKVTALASGVNSTITASYKGKTVTCNVTVASEVTNSFKVEPNYIDREYDVENPNNNIIEITATYTTITDGKPVSENVTTYSDCYWSCSDENISVEKGIITILDHGVNNAKVNVSYKGFNAYITVNVPAISVTTQTIEISFEDGYSNQFNSDESTKLIATLFTETDGTIVSEENITNICTWELSNNIDFQINKGVVTTNSFNTSTTVTAKYSGVTSNSITVTAIKVEEPIITYSLEIIPETITLNIGDTQTMEVKYYTITDGLKDGGVNVTDKCTWIYDEQLFSINNGVLSALTDDVTGVISATYNNITSNEVSVIVNKTEIQYTYELSIEPTEINTVKDEETEISVWLITKEGDNEVSRISVTDNCTWGLDDNITVENGKVIVTKGGVRGTIIANYENMSATCSVTCADEYSYTLVASPANIDIKVGDTRLILLYKNTYKNGELFDTQDVTGATWTPSSSHINVTDGTVTLNSFGENGSVTAEYDGLTVTIPVTISAKTAQKLVITHPESAVSPADVTISPNETTQFYAYLITEVNDVKESEIDVTSDCKWSSCPNENVNVYGGLAMSEKGGIVASIKATYTNGENVMVANATLRTSDLIEYSLVVSPEEVVITINDEQQFDATFIVTKNGEVESETLVTDKCRWNCANGDNEVGTILGGLFIPNQTGVNVPIIATYSYSDIGNIVSNETTVIVMSNTEHRLVMESKTITLDKDFVEPLIVKYQEIVDGEIAKEVDVTEQCTFSSQNSTIASVDNNGVVTAIANGVSTKIEVECFISNIDRTLTAECEVIVNEENYPYMYIQTLENDTEISFSVNTLTYSVDGVNWNNTLDPDTTISIGGPTRVYFKATDITPTKENGIGTFNVSKPFNVGGNIMSLILGDNYDSYLDGDFDASILKAYLFKGLFKNCTNLQRVSKSFLSLTKIPGYCYQETFSGCSSLRNIPEIPTNNLPLGVFSNTFENCTSLRVLPIMDIIIDNTAAQYTYNAMFKGCTSIKDASVITIYGTSMYAYMNMFENCTSLEKGANILAEQLNIKSCFGMYKNCSNLSYIKLLSTDISTIDCLGEWVYGVAPQGTFVKHKDATWDVVGINGVPEGWEIVYEDENGVQTHETMVSGYITNGGASTYSMRSVTTGLSNANVGIYGTTMTTTTDENGYYEFPKTSDEFENGSLICYANGYEPQLIDINGNNNVDVVMAPQAYNEMFEFDYSVERVSVFNISYGNFIRIDVSGKTEDVVNEFEVSINDEAKSWLGASGFEYIVPTKDGAPIADMPPYITCRFDVEENKGRERVGYIKVQHSGGWSGTFTVIQNGALLPNDIPSDAFKVVRPGVTPWFMTREGGDFPDYWWGRAEKVLYINNELLTPLGSVYVPGVTEHTTVQYYLSEINEYSSDSLSSWCFDIGKNEGWWDAPNYNGFKHYGINLGPNSNFDVANATHRTVVITFLVKNYNNTIGNYMAFDVRIVQCKNNITEKEFNKIVAKYGPSNYDGTMNNLSRFSFGELPTPDKVIRGTTPYVTTYEWSNGSYSSPKFGECDRVLYLTNKQNMVAFKINYPDGIERANSTVFSCRDGEDNVLENWLKRDANGKYTIGSTTDFIPKNNENHRVINFNFTFYFHQGVNMPLKRYDIPFKVVQCKEGITHKEFAALVAKYGTSNYDCTMGRLDAFGFWRENNNINLDNLTGTWVDKNNTDSRMTIIKRNDSYTFQTGASTFVGEFNLQISENDEIIIVGSADQNNNEWEHEYIIEELTETSMKWVATDNHSIIYEYIRS